MDITPEMLSAVAGAIAGWAIAASIQERPGLGRKLRILLLLGLLFVLFEGGLWAVERFLVSHLDDFFASGAFALGALVGAIMASSAGDAPLPAHWGEDGARRWRR